MNDLLPLAERVAAALRRRRETIAVAESSAGGLISAALLALPGASAYFVGGAIVYTARARAALGIDAAAMRDLRPSTEPYALLLAGAVRARHQTDWGLSETGATGLAGNRYGDAPGHACVAVAGSREHSRTVETGVGDRTANMRAFAAAALALLAETLEA